MGSFIIDDNDDYFGDDDYGDDRYRRPTRSSMPPRVRGYDDRGDYDRDRDDRLRDDDDYDDDYDCEDDDVNGGAENVTVASTRERTLTSSSRHRRRYEKERT